MVRAISTGFNKLFLFRCPADQGIRNAVCDDHHEDGQNPAL